MKWVKFEDSLKPFNLILPHKMHFMKCMRNLQLANGAREYTNIKQTYDYFFMNE